MSQMRYEKPNNLQGVLDLLTNGTNPIAILAGGTDLLVHMRSGWKPQLLIDIKGVKELTQLNWSETGDLTIGACVSMHKLAQDQRIKDIFPALAHAASTVGSHQIRVRATLAGNLCNGSPCADTAPPLIIYGAKIRIQGKETRDLALEKFFLGPKKTALMPGECVTALILPAPPATLRSGFRKLTRIKGHDLALVNAAASFNPETNRFRLAVGSVAPTPLVITLPKEDFVGKNSDEIRNKVVQCTLDQISPIDDVRASAEYRRDMTAHLCRQLVDCLLSDH